MPATTFIYPYRAGSRSARALSERLGGRLIRLQGSRFRPGNQKTIINWGSTDVPPDYVNNSRRFLNHPEAVRSASNKRLFFERNAGSVTPAQTPDWTCSKDEAASWLEERPNQMLFARTVLAGHSGEGITRISNQEDLAGIREGTLIVKYVKKLSEFRIHVGRRGEEAIVIDAQKKLRSSTVGDADVDYQIRSHANGFIFARSDIDIPPGVLAQARQALLNCQNLDFGAVDVIWNARHSQAYVLEVNTAPGLEGQTVENYGAFFETLIN